MHTGRNKKVGLALGSGSARGLAHIGVIRELEALGVVPDIVCGTSVGALVGACHVCGKLTEMEEYVRRLDTWSMFKMMDIGLIASGGFMEGQRFIELLQRGLGDVNIEDLDRPFAAVATDMETGQEIWFTEGPLIQALRATISLPVLFTPCARGDQWLLDGGLVNPVPVSLCRALGASVVVAVNLNGELVGTHFTRPETAPEPAKTLEAGFLDRMAAQFEQQTNNIIKYFAGDSVSKPGLFDVLASFIDIMQDRITRSRMAGDPPDIMLVPRLGHLGLLDFDHADEAITEGRACVRSALPALERTLGL